MVSIASDDVESIESPDADADAAAATAAATATATDAPVPAGIPTDASPAPPLPVVESVIASGFATTNTASSGPLSTGLSVQAAETANDASPDSHMQIPGPYAASL